MHISRIHQKVPEKHPRETNDVSSFIKRNKYYIFLLFAGFFIISFLLIRLSFPFINFAEYPIWNLFLLCAIISLFLTVLWSSIYHFVFIFLKNSGSLVYPGIRDGIKEKFYLFYELAIISSFLPSFIWMMSVILDIGIAPLIMILLIFLIPLWIFFSMVIHKIIYIAYIIGIITIPYNLLILTPYFSVAEAVNLNIFVSPISILFLPSLIFNAFMKIYFTLKSPPA